MTNPNEDMFKTNDGQPVNPTNPEDNKGNPSSPNPWDDLLKSIKNENGEPKYKDVNSALSSIPHSQQFIDTLKNEKQTLENQLREAQAELEKRESVEQVVQKLFDDRPNNQNQSTDPSPVGGLDENKVRELFSAMMNQQRSQETQASNLQQVTAKLSELYGDKAKTVIADKAKELSTTAEELGKLAANNPTMALALLGGSKLIDKAPAIGTITPNHQPPADGGLEAPKKPLLRGATSREVNDYWQQVKQDVYKRFDVQT